MNLVQSARHWISMWTPSLTQIRFGLGSIHLINLSFVIFLIDQHLNFLQIDLAGHIASAAQFARSGSHAFNDRMFLGTTHGLFYPPIEDWLIYGIRSLTDSNFFNAYKFYLMGVAILFHFSIVRLWLGFQTRTATIFASALFLFFLNIDKPGLTTLQGLGHLDLLVTGLSNQFISASALLWIMREWIQPTRASSFKISLAIIIAILSHIVVAVPAFALGVLALFLRLPRAAFFKHFFAILGLTAFYTLPFLIHRHYLVSTSIFLQQQWWPWALACTSLLLGWKVVSIRWLSILVATLLTTVTVFPSVTWISEAVPRFHYYRFSIVGLMISIVLFALWLDLKDSIPNRRFKKVPYLFAIVFACVSFVQNKWMNVDTESPAYRRTQLDYSGLNSLSFDQYGRYLVFGEQRSSDTGIDSVLSVVDPDFRSTKGLFWESSYTNTVQSSYLATLLSPPVVLDYFYYFGYPCEVQRCLFDQYVRLFNVKGFIGNIDHMKYGSKEQLSCYRTMIDIGTDQYSFQPTGHIKINEKFFTVFRLNPKPNSSAATRKLNEAVERVSFRSLRTLSGVRTQLHVEVLRFAFDSCVNKKSDDAHFLIPGQDITFKPSTENFQDDRTPSQGIPLAKLSDTEFEFSTSELPSWHIIKLAAQPGMRVLDQNGNSLPIVHGLPHIAIYGGGKIKIRFEPPPGKGWAQLISIATLLLLMGYWVWLSRKSKAD